MPSATNDKTREACHAALLQPGTMCYCERYSPRKICARHHARPSEVVCMHVRMMNNETPQHVTSPVAFTPLTLPASLKNSCISRAMLASSSSPTGLAICNGADEVPWNRTMTIAYIVLLPRPKSRRAATRNHLDSKSCTHSRDANYTHSTNGISTINHNKLVVKCNQLD